MMGGGTDLPQRSSSPLKRRASSMEPEQDNVEAQEDVDMIAVPDVQTEEQEQGSPQQDSKREDAAPSAVQDNEVPMADMKVELPLRNGNLTLLPPLRRTPSVNCQGRHPPA
jgi:hypothetical protein